MNYKIILIFMGVCFLTGCITLGTETTMPREVKTGIYEVRESKKAGEEKRTERKEIVVKTLPEERIFPKPDYPEKYQQHSSKEVAVPTEPAKAVTQKELDHIVGSSVEKEKAKAESNWRDVISCSVVYGRANLWTTLTSDFSSDMVNVPKWHNSLAIGGEGEETELRWDKDRDEFNSYLSFGIRIGGYHSSYENNNFTMGDYNVTENVSSRLDTVGADVRCYFSDSPFYISGGFGYLSYSISTSIITNIPQYTYNGISGKRGLLTVNAGAGVAWPRYSRWQLKADLNLWLPEAEHILENAAGQLSAGVKVNF